MAKVTPISEHFQHFLAEMKESLWRDLYGEAKLAWRFFELQSERQRDRSSGWGRYEVGKRHLLAFMRKPRRKPGGVGTSTPGSARAGGQ
jgi:hypothetical protein